VSVTTGGSGLVEDCYFNGNSAGTSGDNIYNYGATVTSITGCPAGYATTQEIYTLDDNVEGTHYSYTCTKCDAGNGSAAGDASCST